MELRKSTIFAFYVVLFQILDFASADEPKQPNIYRWIEQNSYICDPSLVNRNSPKFLSARQAGRLKCSCGDPLLAKLACAQTGRSPPKCFRLPDSCMREYTVIFAKAGNRMLTPLSSRRPVQRPHPPKKKKKIINRKRNRHRPHPHPQIRRPTIVGTVPVTAVVRVKKPTG